MKRIKATAEIRALKELIRYQRCKIMELSEENEKLREELIESKSKEGKGLLETVIENLADAFSSIDLNPFIEKSLSDMNDDNLEITGGENND